MRHSLAVFLLLTLAACSVFEPLPEGDPNTKAISAEELYQEAKTNLNDGEYSTSLKRYERLQARYPYGNFAQQAMLEMAYAYYRQGEPAPAIATADRFIKQFPNNPHVDYAYYLKGLVNFEGEGSILNNIGGQDPSERDPHALQESFDNFKELVTRYPNSRYTPDAKVRMQYLINTLAKHDLHIASYYLRRGAYLSAVNRAQDVLTKYPNSPATHDALNVLVQGYDAMGLTQLRDDAQLILSKNGGATVSLLSNQPEKIWWQFWK
ncbi:MAG: outer membrane protein assembly factor BamD [Gallionella sp.]